MKALYPQHKVHLRNNTDNNIEYHEHKHTSLVDGGGAVDDKGERLVRGNAEAQRVGA